MSNNTLVHIRPSVLIRDKIAKLAATIPLDSLTSRGPTEKEDVHVTLFFAGELDVDREDEFEEMVRSVADRTPPMWLESRGTEILRRFDASIIVATVEGPGVTELNMELSQRWPDESIQQFKPHITLGYLLPGVSFYDVTAFHFRWIVRNIHIDFPERTVRIPLRGARHD